MTEPDLSLADPPLPSADPWDVECPRPARADGRPPAEDLPPLPTCSQCGAARGLADGYCGDCGFIHAAVSPRPAATDLPTGLVANRYRIDSRIGGRGGVARFAGTDIGSPDQPLPVVVVRQAIEKTEPSPETPAVADEKAEATLDFDLPDVEGVEQATERLNGSPVWPSTTWEQTILLKSVHLSLPRLIDSFNEGDFHYLIEERPSGTPLWDAWDRDGTPWRTRFGWMIQLAEGLQRLHTAGAMLEGLKPEMVVVSATGQAILCDLTDLLPLPLPDDVPVRGGFTTAPELTLNSGAADERADVYAFGALLYALLMERELSDIDFTLTGMPRPFLDRFPDANPFLARVMSKTFVRELDRRFPTEDGSLADPTGFTELIDALDACRRNLDRVRLDAAAWSTTGMVRSGNEDAVAILHSGEGRLDDADEFALILLCDGMGGMESGEVAAALAIQTLRQRLVNVPPFAAFQTRSLPAELPSPALPAVDPFADFRPDVTGLKTILLPPSQFSADGLMVHPADRDSAARGVDAHAQRVVEALRDANRAVFDGAKHGLGGRGMGCTAEVVLIDGPTAIIGHVGDSRVYHGHRGRLKQVTRDQTLVNRLVELGHLSPEDAETHPRRAELQQAIGGRPDVQPDAYTLTLGTGDWLLVCSDGLSNQLSTEMMELVLRESPSAEKAARRLVNLAIQDGANDNVTVAVVRAS